MRYPQQERRQRTLRFEPQPRVSLPEAARQEAVAVLAALIAAVMGDTERVENDGGSDE